MKEFAPRRLLAATDFSEVSTWALAHAVLWARRTGARLTVLHVQEFPPIGGDPYFGSYDLSSLIETTRMALSRHLDEQVRQHVPEGVSVDRRLVAGSPATVIEEVAEEIEADMVVLGTEGRGGLSRFLLGSVAERVLRMATRPTLIVRRPLQAGKTPPEPRVEQILCPMNETQVATAAFACAYATARIFGAHLTALCVVEPHEGADEPGRLARAAEALRQRLLETIGNVPGGDLANCQVQAVARHGDAAEQVIALARETGTDLVVLGAQHRTFFDSTVLGVTTVRVTRHAPCPVLVVPVHERQPSAA